VVAACCLGLRPGWLPHRRLEACSDDHFVVGRYQGGRLGCCRPVSPVPGVNFVPGVQLRSRRERGKLELEYRVAERMVSLLRSSSRIVDAAAGIAAAFLIVGGLLGPDLHRLVHHQEHQSSSAETCEFDGQGAHFEEHWVQASHGDCTLCERVQVSIYDADRGGPVQEDVRTRFRPHRADGLGGSDGDVRGRGPPMKV
jgi:hypothetical protein